MKRSISSDKFVFVFVHTSKICKENIDCLFRLSSKLSSDNEYDVLVSTSDICWVGTNANVFIKLFETQNESDEK